MSFLYRVSSVNNDFVADAADSHRAVGVFCSNHLDFFVLLCVEYTSIEINKAFCFTTTLGAFVKTVETLIFPYAMI